MQPTDKPIVLFDGVCNLCNGAVKFIIKRDPAGNFLFAPLQGTTGQALLEQYNLPKDDFESFVLVDNGKAYQQSTAALRIAKHLGGGWLLVYGFIIVPAFIRNAVYKLIANNRYRMFGRQESCMMPTPDIKKRFLD